MVGETLTVLVTDDDEGCRTLFAEWLGDDNEVLTAPDGEAALSALSAAVDVVFLDREMPGRTGSEVAVAIEESSFDPHVVMVSSKPVETDLIDVPVDGYVRKPASAADLRGVVAEYRARTEYRTSLDEFFALTAKLAAIEADASREELAENERFRRLRWLVAEKRAEVDRALDRSRTDWSVAFRSCFSGSSTDARQPGF